MKIRLIVLGDIKENYLKDAIAEYKKRISRFANIEIIELKENVCKSNHPSDIQNALLKDAEEIKKQIKGYPICLDIDGQQLSSMEIAEKIKSLSLSTSEISFIIGASNGLHQEIKSICKQRWSFSRLTFPHQLMRVIFLEQLYRSFTILNNVSYHK
ncbi:MAG: 23S rRNA (pseudouridine(1915)-N(3))-methyltransferase RlmH [Candidatus Onthoplasma sp.]